MTDETKDGLMIHTEDWPTMQHSRCTEGGIHAPLRLPYGATAILNADSPDRRVEVQVCRKCASLYYHCWSKEQNDG